MKTETERRLAAARSSWYVWIFPAVALVLSGWLFVEYFKQRGPTVRILFDDATGLQAEKTRVRHRGVTIGLVKAVYLSDDGKDVVAEVVLERHAARFAAAGSKFALVSPKVGFEGISGLETIFEGTYIAAQPGAAGAAEKTEFKGRLGLETSEPLDETSPYSLETDQLGSVGPGDPVSFRGLNVGNVGKVALSRNARTVLVQINVQNRYAKLVRSNTVFWRKTGVQAKLGLFNSELKISSLDSLMRGGIDFSTPDDAGPAAKAGTKFALNAAPPKGAEKWNASLEF